MTTYSITNRVSGLNLGTYAADTRDGALDAMARDAGYESHADALATTGEDASELEVTEVEPTDTSVTIEIRRTFKASKAAGNDDGGAWQDVGEAVKALVGTRTGTLDQASLSWTFDA